MWARRFLASLIATLALASCGEREPIERELRESYRAGFKAGVAAATDSKRDLRLRPEESPVAEPDLLPDCGYEPRC